MAEPDVSTWEGRMSMRAKTRAEIAALTEPPPEQDDAGWQFSPLCLHVDPANPGYRRYVAEKHETVQEWG